MSFLLLVSAPAGAEIWVVAEPWPAPFPPEELAGALRLRMPGTDVRVAGTAPGGAIPFVELRPDPPRLRVRRGAEVLLDAPLPDVGAESSRRAALLAAIALETAGDPPEPPAVVVAPVAPAPPPPPRWSLAGALGPSLALDDDSLQIVPVLRLRLRAPLAGRAALEVGGRITGAYGAGPGVDLSIVDRGLWLGAAYRAGGRPVAVEVGLALELSLPSVDVDGLDAPVESPAASHLGVHGSLGVAWSVQRNLAFVAEAAVTFAFAEREYTAGGADLAELGAATLDVTVGPEVRW